MRTLFFSAGLLFVFPAAFQIINTNSVVGEIFLPAYQLTAQSGQSSIVAKSVSNDAVRTFYGSKIPVNNLLNDKINLPNEI